MLTFNILSYAADNTLTYNMNNVQKKNKIPKWVKKLRKKTSKKTLNSANHNSTNHNSEMENTKKYDPTES